MGKVKKYNEDSIYVLSNSELYEIDAWSELNNEERENAEFIEFDNAVASYYGFENCAIFHK